MRATARVVPDALAGHAGTTLIKTERTLAEEALVRRRSSNMLALGGFRADSLVPIVSDQGQVRYRRTLSATHDEAFVTLWSHVGRTVGFGIAGLGMLGTLTGPEVIGMLSHQGAPSRSWWAASGSRSSPVASPTSTVRHPVCGAASPGVCSDLA